MGVFVNTQIVHHTFSPSMCNFESDYLVSIDWLSLTSLYWILLWEFLFRQKAFRKENGFVALLFYYYYYYDYYYYYYHCC